MIEDKAWQLLAPLMRGRPFILADGPGTRPARPFATLGTGASEPSGVMRRAPDAQGMVLYHEPRAVGIEVQFHADDGDAWADEVALRLRAGPATLRARELDVGVGAMRPAVSTPAPRSPAQPQSKVVLEFTLHAYAEFTEDEGLIERLDFDCGHPADAAPHTVQAPARTDLEP